MEKVYLVNCSCVDHEYDYQDPYSEMLVKIFSTKSKAFAWIESKMTGEFMEIWSKTGVIFNIKKDSWSGEIDHTDYDIEERDLE